MLRLILLECEVHRDTVHHMRKTLYEPVSKIRYKLAVRTATIQISLRIRMQQTRIFRVVKWYLIIRVSIFSFKCKTKSLPHLNMLPHKHGTKTPITIADLNDPKHVHADVPSRFRSEYLNLHLYFGLNNVFSR